MSSKGKLAKLSFGKRPVDLDRVQSERNEGIACKDFHGIYTEMSRNAVQANQGGEVRHVESVDDIPNAKWNMGHFE